MATLSLEGTVKDQNEVPVSGASVYIYDESGTLADLFDGAAVPVDNPLVTGDDGFWQAFAEAAAYRAETYWGGRRRLIETGLGIPPTFNIESNYFATRDLGAAGTAVGSLFSSDEEGAMAVYKRTGVGPFYLKLYDVATKAVLDLKFNTADMRVTTPVNAGKAAQTVSKMAGVAGAAHMMLMVGGYHAVGDLGGGKFVWDAAMSKNSHNGGTVIDPDRAFPVDWTNQAQLATWFAAGVLGGVGVWRRVLETVTVSAALYGAKGDYNPATGAGTDDSAAINKAKAIHYGVSIPPYPHLVRDKSINLTNLYAGGLLCGAGGLKNFGAYAGSILYGETGNYPIVDMLGTQGVTVRDLGVVSGLNTPSKAGIRIARSTLQEYAQYNHLDNVGIDIATSPGANGGKGTYGLSTTATELLHISNCDFRGDTGWRIDDTDYFASPSHWAVFSPTYPSDSAIYLSGRVTCHSYDVVGSPFAADNASQVHGRLYTTNALTGGGAIKAGTFGFRLTGYLFSSNLEVYPEACERAGYLEGLDGTHLVIAAIFSATKYVTSVGFWGRNGSTIEFRPTTFGSVAPAYWIDDDVISSWNNCTIIAPLKPGTDFTRSLNRADMRFVANDRPRKLYGSAVVDAPSIANGAQHAFDVAVAGVTLGNWVTRTVPSADPGALAMSSFVKAADTVRAILANNSGGAIDPASITYKVEAERYGP